MPCDDGGIWWLYWINNPSILTVFLIFLMMSKIGWVQAMGFIPLFCHRYNLDIKNTHHNQAMGVIWLSKLACDASLSFGSFDRLANQGIDGHRSYPTWYGRVR